MWAASDASPTTTATAARADRFQVLQYLKSAPGPLSQAPITYGPQCVSDLLTRLRPYELSKGEAVMMLNLRPASVAALNTIVEDMTDRFSAEQQEEMVAIIAQVLGEFEPAHAAEAADVSMGDAAAA